MRNEKILCEEIRKTIDTNQDIFEIVKGKTILVTGATGLIGFALIVTLLTYGDKVENSPKVIACIRSIEKAKELFGSFLQNDNLSFLVSDITKPIQYEGNIDYIIHGASLTSSKSFVNEPVETIKTAISGTINLLEFAKNKKVKSFVYLSSMEVYGTPDTDKKIYEDSVIPAHNTMAVRTSYPESKRMCENVCVAYYSEYNVQSKVIRLTQVFGPGVKYDDSRVFAEFARCVLEKKNIVLHTKGETKRNYLYTFDAVTAVLTVLLKGENGEAYNAANEETYCSIYEMAQMVANDIGNDIFVEIVEKNINDFGYAPTLKMNLDTTKLKNLGWSPATDLKEMFKKLCLTM